MEAARQPNPPGLPDDGSPEAFSSEAVLFLLNSLQVGGSEVKTVRIANALRDRGWPVHLGCLNLPPGLRGWISDTLPVVDFRRKGKFDPGVLSRLADYTRAHRIRGLLCVNLYSTLYGTLFQALNLHWPVRSIACVNTTDFATRGDILKMVVYRPALRRASRVVFGCQRQQEQWIARYGLHAGRCMHVYNGVDLERFSPPDPRQRRDLRREFGFSDEEVAIVAVAQFRPEKRQEDLIAAFTCLLRQGLPVRLVLVGDGPQRARMERMVEETGGAGRVLFCGELDDVRPPLRACDIFVLSSVAVETFSNAALEAMATAKPVILSDIGGASEMVNDGDNGFLYPPGDVESLSEKLRVLVEDGRTRERMAHRARAVAQERFGFESMVRQYEQLLFRSEVPGPSLTGMSLPPSRPGGGDGIPCRNSSS